MRATIVVLTCLNLAVVSGCGESAQDKMLRMAKSRAAISKLDAEQEAATATAAVAPPAVEPAAAPPPPAADVVATPTPPAETPAIEPAPATPELAADPAPAAATTRLTSAVVQSNLPRRDQLLTFSRLGQQVAYTGETQAIGIFDVNAKSLLRQVFNPQITPFSVSFNSDGKFLAVGGLDGTFKVFSLASTEGLDKFQKDRLRRTELAPPRRGHDQPVTATAVNASGALVATGDAHGMLKLWSNALGEPLQLASPAPSLVSLRGYQDDDLLLAASSDNRMLYWPIGQKGGKQQPEAREFPDGTLPAKPTVMVSGADEKGIVVGDAQGRVTMWMPERDQLARRSFVAHDGPILGLGLVDGGQTLVTAAADGDIFRWNLPIANSVVAGTVEQPGLVAASPDGRIVGVRSRDQNLDLYSADDGKPIRRHTLPGTGIRLSAAAIGNDGELVLLGDANGRIHFQDDRRRTVAVTNFGKSPIVAIERPAGRSSQQFAFATQDGSVGVAKLPELQLERPPGVRGNVTAMSRSGAWLVAANDSQAVLLSVNDASPSNSVRIDTAKITAMAVSENLVLIGSSTGDLWAWPYLVKGSTPEVVVKSAHAGPVVAIAATPRGQIWSCDAMGKNRLSNFAGQRKVESQSWPMAIKQVAANDMGKILLVTGDGKLMRSDSVGLPLSGVNSIAKAPTAYQTVAAGGGRFAAVSQDLAVVDWFDAKGSLIGRISSPRGKLAATPQLGGNTIVISDESGSLLAMTSPPTNPLPPVGGPVERAIRSTSGTSTLLKRKDGQVVLASPNGVAVLKLPAKTIPVALSDDGQRGLVSDGSKLVALTLAQATFGSPLTVAEPLPTPTAAAISLDGSRAFLALPDNRLVSVAMSGAGQPTAVAALPLTPIEIQPTASSRAVVVRDAAGRVVVMNVADGEIRYDSQKTSFSAMSVAGESIYLAEASGQIATLGDGATTPSPLAGAAGPPVTGLSVSGDTLVTTHAGGNVRFRSIETGWRLETNAAAPNESLVGLTVSTADGDAGRCHQFFQDGSVVSAAIPAMANLASDWKVNQAVAVASGGGTIVGVDAAGTLRRWSGDASFQELPASDATSRLAEVLAIPGGDQFLIRTADKKLAVVDAADGQTATPVAVNGPVDRILNVSTSRMAAVETGGKPAIVNLADGIVSPLRDDLTQSLRISQLIPVVNDGSTAWIATSVEGKYAVVSSLAAGGGEADFSAPSVTVRPSLSADMLAVASDKTVRLINATGKTLGETSPFEAAVACVALQPGGRSLAACDAAGTLRIFGEDGKANLQVRTPIKTPNSLVWSSDAKFIALTDGSRLVIVDPRDGSISGQLALYDRQVTLAHWPADGLWVTESGGLLNRLRLPVANWEASLGSDLCGIAWTAPPSNSSTSNLLAATKSGQLVEWTASSGSEVSRSAIVGAPLKQIVSVGRGNEFACLLEDSVIYRYRPGGQPLRLPESSALGIRSIVGSTDGKWIYATNDLGQVVARDLSQEDSALQTLPCEVNAGMAIAAGGDRLLIASSDQAQIAIIDVGTRRTNLDPTLGALNDFGVLPDGSFAVVVERANGVSMVPLTGRGDRRTVASPELMPQRLAIHPTGVKFAVVGRSNQPDKFAIEIYDTIELKRLAREEIPSEPTRVSYSADGSLLGVSLTDGRINVHDGNNAALLEAMPPTDGLTTFTFSKDNSRLLAAGAEGRVFVQPIAVRGRVQASSDAIVSLSFHGGDKYILCATLKGDVTLWNRAALEAPQARFQGVDANVIDASVSLDGKYVLAVFDDAENSTMIWNLSTSASSTEAIKPHLVIRSEVPTTAAAFTADSKFLVIGGQDGLIRAWSLDESREVAKFSGHEGPVAAISPLSEKGRFVSGGLDRSIRSWRFPGSLPAPGAAVPEGALADATEMATLKSPEEIEPLDEEDPWDAARQALISGSNDDDNAVRVLDLIEGNEREKEIAKASLEEVLELENSGEASSEQLSRERRRLVESRRKMVPSEEANNLSSYSSGHSNLFFAAQTNFKFGIDQFRPIRLLFADRFLYAARPSSGAAPPVDQDGNPIDDGDNGALLSWDYRYSQLQAHAWSLRSLVVSDLYDIPEAGGVFTVPQMMLFSQDGSSRQFPTVESWATSKWPQQSRQFLAVGTAGDVRRENDILKVFEASDLLQEKITPVSQYRSFEGVVTAMAFANTMPKIAFAVRERSVHRLFIADVETLTLETIEEVPHSLPWIQVDKDVITRNEKASPGITTLKFSPDDRLLLTHGNYAKENYRFIGWSLDAEGHLENTRPKFNLTNEGAFFVGTNTGSVWFINSSQYGRKPNSSGRSRVNKLLVRQADGFGVVNMGSGNIERKIYYLNTQHGQPLYDVSENGRWILMGDDDGMAYLWDAMTGQRFCVTVSEATENALREAGKPLRDLPQRPAHSGPIVGVGLSEPDPDSEYPAFAATFGEENKLKVWELFPIVGLQSEALSRGNRTEETPVSTR